MAGNCCAKDWLACGNFRLLLGDEPEAGSDLGLREVGAKPVKGLIRDLAGANFNEQTLRLVEDLIAFLRQDTCTGAALYTAASCMPNATFSIAEAASSTSLPLAAIVGSSNFTRAGLQTNKELNLAHRANLAAGRSEPERVKGLLESTERKLLSQLGRK